MQGDDTERPVPRRGRPRMGGVQPAAPAPGAASGSAPAGVPAPPVRRPSRMTLGQTLGSTLARPVAPETRDATPRPGRLGPIKLGGGADSAVATGNVPHAVSGAAWGEVPERLRPEVLERAAVLNIRGAMPDEAVRKALAHALEDEAEAEAEFDWAVARAIVRAFPVPFRDPDHRPSPTVLSMAAVVERLCRAELSQPGAGARHREYFEAFGLSPAALDAVSGAYRARLGALRALLAPEPEDEHGSQLPRPVQAMFGMEDEYDGLLRP